MAKTVWLASVAVVTLAMPAAAQVTPTEPSPVEAGQVGDDDAGGEDIIITAQGRAQALQDVPVAVSAVSAESLQNSGATDIRALNQLAPSLLVSSTGSEANASARIRGIGTVGDNPGLESSVATFIDGVYRSRTGAGLNELGEIDRVEVLRGPQGTLFGRNASAGLINIVSRSPSFTFGATGEATYGNYDYLRLAAGITGPITDSVAFRVDGVYVTRDGFYEDVIGGERVNDRDRFFVRGQLLFEPSDALSVRLIGDYTRRDEACCAAVFSSTAETFDPTPGAPNTNPQGDFAFAATNRFVDILRSQGAVFPNGAYPGPMDPFNRRIAVTPGRSYQNLTQDYGGSMQIDYDFGPAALTSITAYREYKAGGAGDFDYGNVDLLYRADDGNAFREFHTFSQELRLQGSAFDGVLDWLIGGYYAREDLVVSDNLKFGTQYGAFAACRLIATANPTAALRNPANPGCLSPTGRAVFSGLVPGVPPAFGPFTPAVIAGIDRLSTVNNVGDNRALYKQDSENFAAFTHNIVNITDRLSLTLGLRYTRESKAFRANFDNNNTVCPAQQAALGPVLQTIATTPGLPAATRGQLLTVVGGILALTCQGNSSSSLNGVTLEDDFDEDEFTGTGILSFKPIDELLLYGSYSRGYKAGGYNLDRSALGRRLPQAGGNSTFSPRTAADVADLRFAAETVNAYELGAKYDGGSFNLNVAAFRQEFSNFQLNTFNGSVFIVQNIASCDDSLGGADTDASPATGNCAGDSAPGVITQGVELEAAMFPSRDITVTLGYTYADTKYQRDLTGDGEALDPFLFLLPGNQVSNAPEHVVTSSFAWTPELGSSGLSGLIYIDGRMTSDYNTGSDLFPEKEQDGFFTANARVGLRGPDERWAVELWAQNIFDEDYAQVAFNAPFQGAGSRAQTQAFGTTANQIFASYLAEPRTYGVTVRGRF